MKLEFPPSRKTVDRSADGSRSSDVDTGLCGKQIGKRSGLALLDFLSANDIGGRGSKAIELDRLCVGGDYDVFRNALDLETKIERAIFGVIERSRTKSRVMKDGCCEMDAVAPGGSVRRYVPSSVEVAAEAI